MLTQHDNRKVVKTASYIKCQSFLLSAPPPLISKISIYIQLPQNMALKVPCPSLDLECTANKIKLKVIPYRD